ncbi:MAG: MATE family efflux transporter [Acidobacteriota bacterium]|nr:MATE family efflux transporter [Acidobacteriota bacterium]
MRSDRIKSIFFLALPIIGGMISQNILNLVDTWMVGRIGNAALGAVGLGGFATFMSQAIILGISSGVQATAARRLGEGKHHRTAVSLNAGLMIVLVIAPVLSIVLYNAIPHFYYLLNNDPDVMLHGKPYFQARVLGITFVGINFAFRGYWNGVNRAWFYMGTLILMHTANIFLNWVFIFGNLGAPEMGAAGAGLATTSSVVLGSAIYVILGITQADKAGFLNIMPSMDEIRSLIRLSLPSGIQQLFFAAGFTATFLIIGKVGQMELAAANVLINVTLVAILPGMALGLAAASLVGQALGRNDPEDASNWAWDVVKVGMVIMGVLGLPMLFVPDMILKIFLTDPATVEVARLPMRIVGFTMIGEAVGMVLMNALLGAGAAKTVMVVSIVAQWLVFLPLAVLVGPVLGFGLLGIWILQGVYRALQSLTFAMIWVRGDWRTIKV